LAVERIREGRGTARCGGDCAAAPGRLGSERKKKKGKGKGRLTGGAQVSASRGKRKRRGGEVGWRGCWLTGLWAVWAERGADDVFFFFLFLFQLHFQTIFHFKFKSNFFKLFLNNFINFLETTQATKNHARQLMMHKHLLSLSLLNYI
jgi:hypothetical protein